MKVERDPDRALGVLRDWARGRPRQPIIAVYLEATATDPPEWAFQQKDRDEVLTVAEATVAGLQSRGLLEIQRSALDGTWRARAV